MTRDIKLEKNPRWTGGIRQRNGYIQIKKRNHPYCDAEGYVFQHRLRYEQFLSIIHEKPIFLSKNMDIHHRDGDKKNNSLINLELISRSEHTIRHNMIDMSNRICYFCELKETYINKKGRQVWYRYKNRVICKKCKGLLI